MKNNNIESEYLGKKILITGATGYIGKHLVNELLDIDCTIIRVSRSDFKSIKSKKANIIDYKVQLQNIDWLSIIDDVDIIFYLAGQTSAHYSNEYPVEDLTINIIPFVKLLEAIRTKNKLVSIILAGSATQVGMTKTDDPVSEDLNDNPATIYDINKLTAEKYLCLYADKGIVKGCTLRLANVYGPGTGSQADRGILNKLISLALKNRQLTVYGNGEYTRDYVFIDDVVKAFLYAGANLQAVNGKYYLIGSGKGVKLKNAFQFVAQVAKYSYHKNVDVIFQDLPSDILDIDMRSFVADTSNFNTDTGWMASVDFEDGVRKTFVSFLNNS